MIKFTSANVTQIIVSSVLDETTHVYLISQISSMPETYTLLAQRVTKIIVSSSRRNYWLSTNKDLVNAGSPMEF